HETHRPPRRHQPPADRRPRRGDRRRAGVSGLAHPAAARLSFAVTPGTMPARREGNLMDEAQLRREMEGLPFYHTVALTPTLSTPGWPVVVPIVEMVREALHTLDLRGKRVLDIGCRAGLFSFEAD